MGALLLLPLLVVALTHSRWEVSVRAEVRARNAIAGSVDGGAAQDSNSTAAADAEVRPSLSGALFNGPWSLSGSYAPTLRSREPYHARTVGQPIGEDSHELQLDAAWAREGTARASVGQHLHYGTLDLTTLAAQDAAPGVPSVPKDASLIRDLSSDTSAAVAFYLRRTVTLTTSAGFFYGGGVDDLSRAQSPLQATVRGGARLAVTPTARDTVGINLAARYVRFFEVPATAATAGNPGARVAIAELAATYARQLAISSSVDVGLGLTGSFGQLPNTGTDKATAPLRDVGGVAPYLAAGLSHRQQVRAQRFDFRLGGQLAPFVDRFGATAYQRVEANGSVGWTHVRHFSAGLATGYARSLPNFPDLPLNTVYTEANAGYAPDPWWRLDLVSRLSLLQSGTSPVANQWVIGLSLTLIAASEQPRELTE